MLQHELDITRRLCREAGALTLTYFESGRYEVDEKAQDLGPVTSADRAANAHIVDALTTRFPDDGVLAEESVEAFVPRRRVWLVDPIDGTREFIAGRDEFSVMIALAIDGEPVLGAVYRPTHEALTWAVAGEGAWHEAAGEAPTRLHASATREPSELRVLRSRSHDSERVTRFCESLGVTDQRRLGSYGLKVAEIARGGGDVYLTFSQKTALWDSGAAQVILHEAGGRITTTTGEPIIYAREHLHHQHGTLASNGPCHDTLVTTLRGL